MFLFYFQSNTLTVLGRQMFVNYSKSQEIKRYGGIHTHKFSHAYQPVRKRYSCRCSENVVLEVKE